MKTVESIKHMEVVPRKFQFNQNIGIQAKDHEKKKHCRNTRLASVNNLSLGQTPGHLTFLKNFFQIPGYVSSLDGQMPHQPALQETSNPPATIQKIPIRQTVYSNVNILLSTTEISKASES